MSCSPNLLSSPPSHEPVEDEIHYSRIHSISDHCLLTMIALKIRVLESMSQLEGHMTKRMRPHLWAKVWDWIWAKVGAEKEAQEGSVLIAAIRLSPTQCWDAGSTACCQDLSKLTKSFAFSLLDQTYSACGLLDEKDEMNWPSHCKGWVMHSCKRRKN